MTSIGNPGLWLGFGMLVLLMLAVDLGAFRRRPAGMGLKQALAWSVAWVGLAAAFNLWLYFQHGSGVATQFLAGYLIEKTLSLDNVFVFIVVFSYFKVRQEHQHRVLFWGVLGALVMRAVLVYAGASLVHRFGWVLPVFGVVLAVTGVKLLSRATGPDDLSRSGLVPLFRRFVPMTEQMDGRYFVRNNGWRATPLLLVLVVVEASDLLFAIDSVPAIFAVTSDPFVVLTSNVFAVLGMRALYFALAGVAERLQYLRVGLAVVLAFIGGKMIIGHWYKLPVFATIVVVLAILGGSALFSLWKNLSDELRRQLRKQAFTVAGFALVCTGCLGLLLPVVPGIPLLIPGLLFLSPRYPWARRAVRWLRTHLPLPMRRGKRARSLRGEGVAT